MSIEEQQKIYEEACWNAIMLIQEGYDTSVEEAFRHGLMGVKLSRVFAKLRERRKNKKLCELSYSSSCL